MSLPAAFLARFEGRVIELSADAAVSGSNDEVSWHLLNRARDATALAFSRAGYADLNVSRAYLEAVEPRAFTFWSPAEPSRYVIACNRGTAMVMRQTLSDGDFRSLLPGNCVALRSLHGDDLGTLAVALTLATVLYHEVAHVTRFHLPYLHELATAQSCELQALTGLCEADADRWCSYLIAADLRSHADGIRTAVGLQLPLENVLREVLTLYAVALHLWQAFFNRSVFRGSSIYPHPLIRSTRIAVGAADNIPQSIDEVEDPIGRAAAVLRGLAAVEQDVLRAAGQTQRPFDLAKELDAINARFADFEPVLDRALRDVERRWGRAV